MQRQVKAPWRSLRAPCGNRHRGRGGLGDQRSRLRSGGRRGRGCGCIPHFEAHDFSQDPDQRLFVHKLKFVRSNQNICFNQRPRALGRPGVGLSDHRGDGPATENGELALGQNVTVMLMPRADT
ncbi:MAG: hypothetical protein R2941_17500 [Desulfobacterales bacterium]